MVQNPGFESGTGSSVPNWNFGDPSIGIDTTAPRTQNQDLYFNVTQTGYGGSYAYQDTPAGSVTPGTVYTYSFYAAGNFANGGEGHYQLAFFGSSGFLTASGIHIFTPTASYSVFPGPSNNTFTAPAGASYAELQFWAITGADAGSTAQLHLDDVSLSSGSGGGTGGGASAWNISGGGDYNTAGNWTNGVPNAVDAEADLFSAISSGQTITTSAPITVGTLNFNNSNEYILSATGAGSLTMQASSGSAKVIVQSGTHSLSLPLVIASNTGMNVSSGATLLVSGPVTVNAGMALNAFVDSNGSLALASSAYLHSLTLNSNANARIAASAANSRKLLQLDSLTAGASSTLDLTNNDLIVHGGTMSTINTLVQTAYNRGAWNGTGITSSSGANDTTHLTALGIAQASSAGTFDGAGVAAGDISVRYTFYGDATLDGKVDGSDYSRIDNGFLANLTGWANGDFNYDGVINGSDYTLIDNTFNNQGSPIAAASEQLAGSAAQIAGSSVPEPGSLSLLFAAAAGLLRRRRARSDW